MANSTSQFGGFLTNIGIAQQANNAALGLPWNITHMLIGDAGGEPSQTPDPTPNPAQTALVRQVYRAQLNALYPSPADPAVLVAELVLPPEIGGWWIRELALEDGNGNFIAVAKPAPSYKPLLAQGSGRTQTIRMHVVFGNVANVTLKVDPSVVLATREYVDGRIVEELHKLDGKNSVRAATTGPITLAGIQTLDGVGVRGGDRVLVKDQAQGGDNGIYVVAAGPWERARDADTSADVTPGMTVTVEQGEKQADSLWKLVTDAPLVLGVTPLLFRNITAGYNGTSPRRTGGMITAADAGKMVYYYGAEAGQTLTLPAATTLPVGGTVNVQNVSTVPVVIAKTGTDTIQIGGVGGVIDSLMLYPGSELELTCVSNYEWFAQGTGALHRMNGLPTLAPGTANGQLATAGFVQQELAASRGSGVPLVDGEPSAGISAKASRDDHRHPTDFSRAPLDSPAFIGSPTAPLPALFDDSTTIATTEFVRRHGGQFSGASGYTAGAILPVTDAGKLVYFAGSSPGQVFTLPSAANVFIGARFSVQNLSGVPISVARVGVDFIHVGGEQLTALVIPPGGEAVFTRANLTAWCATGSATLGQVASFANLKAANGWERMPSGIIRQWGTAANGDMGQGTIIVLPTTYPNQHFITIACADNSTGEIETAYVGNLTLSGFRLCTQSQSANGGPWNNNVVAARYYSLGW